MYWPSRVSLAGPTANTPGCTRCSRPAATRLRTLRRAEPEAQQLLERDGAVLAPRELGDERFAHWVWFRTSSISSF